MEFNPENELEHALVATRQGTCTLQALIVKVTESNLYIASQAEVLQDGSGFKPVLMQADSQPLVAVFSSLSRQQKHVAEYILMMMGRDFFLRMPPGYGVVLNPGYAAPLIIPPETVSNIKRDLTSRGSRN